MKKIMAMLTATSMFAAVLAGCGTKADVAPAAGEAETTSEAAATEAAATEEATGEAQVLKVAAFEGGYGAEMWTEVAKAFE